MDCCTTIYDIGCLYSCDLIPIGVTASVTGVYTLQKQPDGEKIVSNTITSGNSIVFSGGYLNEDAVTVFKVLDPNGSYVSGPGSEDCFQVQIQPAMDATLSDVECPPTSCADATVENSDVSYSATVASGGTLVLPDTTYNIYISGNLVQSFTLPTLADETVNILP